MAIPHHTYISIKMFQILTLLSGLMTFTISQDLFISSDFYPHRKPVLATWNRVEVLDDHNGKD